MGHAETNPNSLIPVVIERNRLRILITSCHRKRPPECPIMDGRMILEQKERDVEDVDEIELACDKFNGRFLMTTLIILRGS